MACVKQIVDIIGEMRDCPLISNMIFIADNYSDEYALRLKSFLGANANILFSNDVNFELDQNSMPYFFILNSKNEAKKLFIPHLKFPEATTEYLYYILNTNL